MDILEVINRSFLQQKESWMLRKLGLGGNRRVEPVVDSSIQKYLDKKFEEQNAMITELKNQLKTLGERVVGGEEKVLPEIRKVRELFEARDVAIRVEGAPLARGVSTETVSEGTSMLSPPSQVPRLTSGVLRKHADSSTANDEGRSRLTSYEREEIFFDAADALPSARDGDNEQLQTIADELSYSFDASKAVFVCEVLNEIAGEVPIVGSIVSILTNIFEKIDEAQTNKDACEALGSRIFDLSIALKDLLLQERNVPGIRLALRKLKNKLNEASEFITTFSRRGWLKALLKGSSDTGAFKSIEEDLTKVIGDVQFQVMAKMVELQGKTFEDTTNINANVKRLMDKVGRYGSGASASENAKTIIEKVGGVKGLGGDAKAAKKVADELGVSLEEIQGEACAYVAESVKNERELSSPNPVLEISPSIVRHRGFREFWEAKLTNKKEVSIKDLRAAVVSYLKDLDLDIALVEELTGQEGWQKISKILDEDGDSSVSLFEIRRFFNIIRAKNQKDDDFVSGLRAIIRFYDKKKKNSRNHLKPGNVKAGEKNKKRAAMIGRSAESTILVQALLSANQNDYFHAVEVCGDDGVGKTFFCNAVCRLSAIQERFPGGIFYTSLDTTGSERQRSARSSQEVAMSIIDAMNFDVVGHEIRKERPMEFLEQELAKRNKNRSLLVLDGVDSDSTDKAFEAIARLAGLPYVSAILITSDPLQHPSLVVSTRIMLEPLTFRDAARLVQSLNPNLTRKARKKIITLANGNPANLLTLAQLSNKMLDELHLKQKKRGSSTPASSPGFNSPYVDPGSSFTVDSRFSHSSKATTSSNDSDRNPPFSDNNSLLGGTGNSDTLSMLYGKGGKEADEKLRKISVNAEMLGFEWPQPEDVKRASSDPIGRAQKAKPQISAPPKTLGDRQRTSRLALVEMGSPRSTTEQHFLSLVLSTLGLDEQCVLNLLGIVPSSFEMEYFEFCFNHAASKRETWGGDNGIATHDTPMEMIAHFERKGFVDVASNNCERFTVCRRWKKAVLRSLLLSPELLDDNKKIMGKYYANLLDKGGKAWTGGGEGSWKRDEGILKVSEDVHNVIAVLKEGALDASPLLYDGTKVFMEGRDLLKTVLDDEAYTALLSVMGVGK